jgi:hydroxyacylglutathione hydrolase
VYFSYDAQRNRQAHALLDEEDPPPSLTLDELVAQRDAGAAVLDTRDPLDFAAGHLRGSINVGLHGRFAELGGDVLAPDRPVVLVSEPGTELEAKVRLGRVGFDRIEGTLADPLRVLVEHQELVTPSSRLTVEEFDSRAREVGALQIVDVRNPGETAGGAIPGAATIPLPQLTERMGELDPARPTVLYCASGYRSSIAASALAAAGFDDVSDLLGGYEAWKAQHSDGREKEPHA